MQKSEQQLIDIINQVDEWQGKKYQYELVPGGKTNINWKITVEGNSYFVKVPGAGTESFIDRKNCHEANRIAQKEGIGPDVFLFFPETIEDETAGCPRRAWESRSSLTDVGLQGKSGWWKIHFSWKEIPAG